LKPSPNSLPPRPTALRMQPEKIPVELKEGRRFVLWRWQWTEARKKWTKPPLQFSGKPASATDPSTWVTFVEAHAAYQRGGFDGIGLVVTKKDGLAGIDLDGCRDPNTGVIDPWALEVVTRFQSYAELSPSGTGIRIWLKGELPPHGRKKGPVEVYDDLRFLTLTGHALPDTTMTIERQQDELVTFHREVFGERQPVPDARANAEPISLQIPDDELLGRARAAKNGAEFAALFDHGDLGRHDGDHSRADLALCCSLSFWTNGDATSIDRLFRRSALMRPKWDERHFGDGRTYGQATVAKAQELVREGWRPAVAEPPRSGTGNNGRPVVPGGEARDDGLYGDQGVPVIDCSNRVLHDLRALEGIADEALRALVAANQEQPTVFERGRVLVRVGLSRAAPDDPGRPIIERLPRDAMASVLARTAHFVTTDARGRVSNAMPPEIILHAIYARGAWEGLPSLAGVIQTPVIRPDGSILSLPGYDRATWRDICR
jgi:putative DNA primase/helicase